ncbi:MAG: hypothetical protein VB980_07075 [Opitutales bacterium]
MAFPCQRRILKFKLNSIVESFDKHTKQLANEAAEFDAWDKALKAAWVEHGSVFPNLDGLVLLMAAFSSVEDWCTFADSIGNRQQMSLLLKAIDASAYPPKEWLLAMAFLDSWLEQREQPMTMESRIGYLSCCAEAVATTLSTNNLKEVAHDMLNLHGIA